MLQKESRIYIAGHTGMVGSAIVRALQEKGYENLLLRTHQDLELTEQKAAREFMEQERPDTG